MRTPTTGNSLSRSVTTRLLRVMDKILPGAIERPSPLASESAPVSRPGPLRYAESCRFQGRGIEPFDTKLTSAGLPHLCALIEDRLDTHGRCKLLEVGCGEGRLLLELLERFGSRLELHGINHPDWPQIAGDSPLHRTNEHYQVLSPLRLFSLPLPALHAADVQDLSAFPLRDFDLIISQAVLPHVPDKVQALEQTAQRLAPDGIFVHELDCADLPSLEVLDTDLPRLAIYDGSVRVSARERLSAAGIELLSCQRKGGKGEGILALYHNRAQPLRLGLTFQPASEVYSRADPCASTPEPHSITVCDGAPPPWGVRSVYRMEQSKCTLSR